MIKFIRSTLILIVCSIIYTPSLLASDAGPIKIAISEWTGQHISARIAGSVLQKMGFETEYVTAGAVPQFTAISEGSLHFQPEVWTNNVGDIYPKAVKSGKIVVIGQLGLQPKEGWFYPPYMEETCPGLPSYKALYDCAQAFAAAETFPNGRLITYPADWGTRSSDQVKAIGLPFQAVAGGSEGAMLAEMKSAVAAKQPLLMMFWQPHWVHADITLNIVEWDSSSSDCVAGVNQSKGNTCGFAQATVDKVVTGDFAEKWPKAFAFAEKYSLSNDIQNLLILAVDQEGRPVDDVVAEWLAANETTWKSWIN
jgi:glycine betaine/proline transport system substrate-binding protein